MAVSVLGSLVLSVDGTPVEVPGVKRRAVLALLAMSAPEAVSVDRLVDAVWPDEPPASGRAALQSHVSRLRRHLGVHADRLSRSGAGYRLELDVRELDATRLADLTREARMVAETNPGAALALLAAARDLWRSPPLAELADVEQIAAWSRTLTDQWLGAVDLLAESALRAGDPEQAASSARTALSVEPLRERSALLLMRALAERGMGAAALRTGHEFRQRLRDETGLDPSPALGELESEVASGDLQAPSLSGSPPPAVRSPGTRPIGPLIGRDAEVAGVCRLIGTERLVTILGPGGVGKTRVALEAVHRSEGPTEATIVHLAAVTDPLALPDVLARCLGLDAGPGRPLDRCVRRLRSGPHLLVVDNCEHLLQSLRRVLDALLTSCPELTVLATSRERLAIPGELASRLEPLPMPGYSDEERTRRVPSVALFVDRARRVRPGFPASPDDLAAAARIVRRLDGIPLAIELAAGRLSSLSIGDLESRLDRALDLLGSPAASPRAEDRHATLRTAVSWSYDLLPAEEQRLFRHLAVFPGGFDLPTAEWLADHLDLGADPATALAHLVDSSMVVAELDDRPRYRMLDTLRTYGLDRLSAAGELDAAVDRLLAWAVDLSARLDASYDTPAEPESDRLLRTELANLRTAWRSARDRGDLDVAGAMAVNLYSFASWRDLTELFRWSLELADDPRLQGHPAEAQVLGVASEAAWSSTGDLDRAEDLARRSIEVVRPDDDWGRALGTWALADVRLFRGDYETAGRLAIEARAGTRWAAEGYAQAALAAAYAGDHERAGEHLAEASTSVGGPTLHAYLRYIAAEVANASGRWDDAQRDYVEAIGGARQVGATFVEGISSLGLVTAQAAAGDVRRALDGYLALIDRWERTGGWTQQWTTLRNLADLFERLGEGTPAEVIRAAADEAPEAAALAPVDTPQGEEADPAGAMRREEVLALARTVIGRLRSDLPPGAT